MTEISYAGSELEIFAKAQNWKAYWGRQIRPFVRGAVLEVGAGIGANTRTLAAFDFERWTCLEPDPALAREIKTPDPRYDVVVGTLATLPASRHFDSILYIDVLEHIKDDHEEMRRAAERLNPGGAVIVLSPAHQSLYTPFDEAIGHFRRYNVKTLAATAPPLLNAEKMIYLDSVGLLASAANRLFLNSSMPTEQQILFWDRVLVRSSRVLDRLLLHKAGKSVLGIWTKA